MMEKEKIILPIGNSKSLVYEADPADKEDLDFVERCKEIAATKPQSIQDFFIRLSELHQKHAQEPAAKISRKKGMGQ